MNVPLLSKSKEIAIRSTVLPAVITCAPRLSEQQKFLKRTHKLHRYKDNSACGPASPSCTSPHISTSALRSIPLREYPVLYMSPTLDTTTSFSDYQPEHMIKFFTNGPENQENQQEKELAMARMLDNINQEMPKLLEDHDYTIYAADMEFISYMPILRTVHGRQSYKMGLNAWFKSLSLLYSDLYIDVMETTKEDGRVSVRWGICGTNRINSCWSRVFDGASTFFPDHEGLIKTHILDKIAVDKWKLYQRMETPLG